MYALLMILAFLLAEIAGFILVGEALGVVPTLALVLLGIVAGIAILRHQGFETLMRVKADVAADRTPTRSLADGAAIAVAALLIAIPGFVSDAIGLLLLLPPVRSAAIRTVRNRFFARMPPSARGATRPAVINLDRNDYRAPPRTDTPWRGPEA